MVLWPMSDSRRCTHNINPKPRRSFSVVPWMLYLLLLLSPMPEVQEEADG